MDGILISEPVAALDGVIGVPSPVVFVHVTEGSIDASLCGNGVGSGGEKFRNTGGFETLLNQTKGSSEAGTSGSDDDGIKGMIDDCIFFKEGILG